MHQLESIILIYIPIHVNEVCNINEHFQLTYYEGFNTVIETTDNYFILID